MNLIDPTSIFLSIFDFIVRAFSDPVSAFPVRIFLSAIAPYTLTLSFFFFVPLVYAVYRITQIRTIEYKFYADKVREAEEKKSGTRRNEKWERVMRHIESTNPNDWRLAIMEADIMLEEVVNIMGYHGKDLGEKLRSIEKSDFTTIDKAWEAHRVRNQIAHEGADFLLEEREARRVIKLYEDVFQEFRYI